MFFELDFFRLFSACGTFTAVASDMPSTPTKHSIAVSGQWPSIVALSNVKSRKTCAASILSPNWLLGSYSCLYSKWVIANLSQFFVRVITEWLWDLSMLIFLNWCWKIDFLREEFFDLVLEHLAFGYQYFFSILQEITWKKVFLSRVFLTALFTYLLEY